MSLHDLIILCVSSEQLSPKTIHRACLEYVDIYGQPTQEDVVGAVMDILHSRAGCLYRRQSLAARTHYAFANLQHGRDAGMYATVYLGDPEQVRRCFVQILSVVVLVGMLCRRAGEPVELDVSWKMCVSALYPYMPIDMQAAYDQYRFCKTVSSIVDIMDISEVIYSMLY